MNVVMAAMKTEALAEAMVYDSVLADTVVILVETQFPFSEAEHRWCHTVLAPRHHP